MKVISGYITANKFILIYEDGTEKVVSPTRYYDYLDSKSKE